MLALRSVMFAHSFRPSRFLRSVAGTEAFRAYCEQRGIGFDHTLSSQDFDRWAAAVAALPPDEQAEIDLELAQVQELSGRDGNGQLLTAAVGGGLPLDHVPSGPPLALWFLVRHPDLFREVFFHHEARDARAWRVAKAPPGIVIGDLDATGEVLGDELRAFFRQDAGTGLFCAAEAHRLPDDTACFALRIADRIQLLEGFTERGVPTLQRVRPALAVLFSYRPRDGSVLLNAPLRSMDRLRSLYRCFGRSVLGTDVAFGGEVFDLDRLKQPFRPLPDAEDMDGAWLKALTLQYPARLGRRQVRLEARSGDDPAAVEHLLRRHVGDAASELTVTYSEIRVRLRLHGRPKTVPVRLWRDRSSLDRTPLGDRLRACLDKWGLTYAQR